MEKEGGISVLRILLSIDLTEVLMRVSANKIAIVQKNIYVYIVYMIKKSYY